MANNTSISETEELPAISDQQREINEKKALLKNKQEALDKREEELEDFKKVQNEKKATLAKMEKDLQTRCQEFDDHSTKIEKDFDERTSKIEKELDERQKKLDEKVGCFTSAERFMKTQELLNEVYTLFIMGGGEPEELYESLKLILEARAKF